MYNSECPQKDLILRKVLRNILRKKIFILSIVSVLLLLTACAKPKMLYYKDGLTQEDFNRDKYECVQQSRTSWSGGGTGAFGIAMIIGSKSNAEAQSAELFKMCMEARGYTAREVGDEEFERQKNTPLKTEVNKIGKERKELCNREEFRLVIVKTPCNPESISLAQLSDNKIISEDEKTVFSKFRAEYTNLNNKLLEAIETKGDLKDKEFGLILGQIYLQADNNALNLFEGKITWGEFNKNRKEFNQKIKEERNRIIGNK